MIAGTHQSTQLHTYSTSSIPAACLHTQLYFASSKLAMPALETFPPLFCLADLADTPTELQNQAGPSHTSVKPLHYHAKHPVLLSIPIKHE